MTRRQTLKSLGVAMLCGAVLVSPLAFLAVTAGAKVDDYALACKEAGGTVVATDRRHLTCIEARVIPVDGKGEWRG